MRLSLLGTSFTAWIMVDDVESEIHKTEYSMDDSGNPVASCWIESTVGKTFGIYWRDSMRKFYTSSKVSLDGVTYPGRYHIPPSPTQGRGRTVACTSARDSAAATTRRKLVFGVLELTDDDALLDQPSDASRIGEIRIEIRQVVLKDLKTPNRDADHDVEFKKPTRIHEKLKKAGSHQIRLGEAVEERRTRRSGGPGKHYQVVAHVGTFIFKYRSRDLLQADGIMPRATPALKVPNVNSSEQDEEEIQRLEARLKELHERRRIKQEPSKIKPETCNTPFVLGEVIDLTLD